LLAIGQFCGLSLCLFQRGRSLCSVQNGEREENSTSLA